MLNITPEVKYNNYSSGVTPRIGVAAKNSVLFFDAGVIS